MQQYRKLKISFYYKKLQIKIKCKNILINKWMIQL